MSTPYIRRPDLIRVDAWRQWIRQFCPPGTVHEPDDSRWGFCADDCDLIFRTWYQTRAQWDSVGPLRLAETKWQGFSMSPSQRIALQRLDQLMTAGARVLDEDDPSRFWGGVHSIEYDDLDPRPKCDACNGTGYQDGVVPAPERDQIRWWVNGVELTADEFYTFLVDGERPWPRGNP